MTRLAEEADRGGACGTPLPAEPDRARVEDFLVRTRRASALRRQPDADDEVVQGVVRGGLVGQR